MIPPHLKRYVIEQDYSRYTPVDQAVWRHIMHQLTAFLSKHAHPCYLEGLEKTGISTEEIPHVELMSEKLQKFGWRAISVSGFIPPAAFMELQSLGYLPIASDMRSVDHIEYTPAPDIVHEAAGHAPILVDLEYAEYLKSYAQVARKALLSSEDITQYEAIRNLSDLKEDPDSTSAEVQAAEAELEDVSAAMTFVSEAALLGRMNWWTAEYGLFGTLEDPKIFGAGLLSSIGEAKACLLPKVKKIPLTVDCVNYTYDITEQQPQLFVTPDFAHLRDVLEDLAKTLSYRVGGRSSLLKAIQAKCANTVELNSGLQISGMLTQIREASSDPRNVVGVDTNLPCYLQFSGPTQLCENSKELTGQGCAHHAQGFGSPLGYLAGQHKCLSEMATSQLKTLGLIEGQNVELRYASGVTVSGKLRQLTRHSHTHKLIIATFEACRVTHNGETLFDPAWGVYDMAIGSTVPSVFGGAADREAYGETDDFVAKLVPRKQWSQLLRYKHDLFQHVREIREQVAKSGPSRELSQRAEAVLEKIEQDFPHEWLLRVELRELSVDLPSESWKSRLEQDLKSLAPHAMIETPAIEKRLP